MHETPKRPVAIVTGASRGAGRGIAIALGSHGCIVYVTGRSERPEDSLLAGTIHETAQAVTAAGGQGIAVRVDHADDKDVSALFDRIAREQGRLDILVNNAALIRDEIMAPSRFWEKSLDVADLFEVGLRSGYVASARAVPLMLVNGGRGLIIFTSAPGAAHYVFGPVYGAHKAGMDKMAADMAIDLADTDITTASIWMGPLLTERLLAMIDAAPDKLGHLRETAETPEFTGHVIWALFGDPEAKSLSGQVLIGAELGMRYSIADEGGRRPLSVRDTHKVHPHRQFPNIIR